MARINEIYKCEVCGNIIEVTHGGAGQLVCCGKPMVWMEENTIDASLEKHVPVIEVHGTKVKIKVGAETHPMEEAHYIEWIEYVTAEKVDRKYLKPGDKPEAEFNLTDPGFARAYCNLHGLWKSK
jgi:superoxide reductase